MNNTEKLREHPPLLLRIIDSDGEEQTCRCDSVQLNFKNDKNDKNGGSIGIRKGHTKSVIALSRHNIKAFLNEKMIFESDMISGIATVDNNTILVLKD